MEYTETKISKIVNKLNSKMLIIINFILFILLVIVGVYTNNFASNNRDFINKNKDVIKTLEIRLIIDEERIQLLEEYINIQKELQNK